MSIKGPSDGRTFDSRVLLFILFSVEREGRLRREERGEGDTGARPPSPLAWGFTPGYPFHLEPGVEPLATPSLRDSLSSLLIVQMGFEW